MSHASLSMLPFETLQYIFIFLLPDPRARIYLSAVCKLWRDTVHHTAQFWRKISPFPQRNIPIAAARRRAVWLIRLAGNTTLLDVNWKPLALEPAAARNLASYFIMKVPFRRWRSLQMDGLGYMEAGIFNAAEGEFSSLQSLTFTETFYSEQFLSSVVRKQARQPESLSVQLGDFNSLRDLSRLIGPNTRVNIESGPQFLERYGLLFVSIRYLSIYKTPDFRGVTVTMKSLLELTVNDFDSDAFNALEFPELRALYIQDFTKVPSNRIESLSIRHLEIKGEGVKYCSYFDVPALETLHLEYKDGNFDYLFSNGTVPPDFPGIYPSKLILNIPSLVPHTLYALASILSPHLSELVVIISSEAEDVLFSSVLTIWEGHRSIDSISRIHVCVDRHRLLSDTVNLEEPTRQHFQAHHYSRRNMVIEWTDGTSLSFD